MSKALRNKVENAKKKFFFAEQIFLSQTLERAFVTFEYAFGTFGYAFGILG